MAREIATVGVVGLGTMGAGIVEVFARGGLTVIGVESSQEYAERGRSILQASTDRAVAKGKLDEAGQADILGRITITTEYAELAPVDLVVEAVPEIMSLKHEVIGRLEDVLREDAIVATNTSSLSITEIAAPAKVPGRIIGMHFFNPAPILKLVEVITTPMTDPEVTETVRSLSAGLGKKPIVVGDRAGFVANYLLYGYYCTAMRMLESGHVSREDLDTAVHVGIGLPMGPLTLGDLVGLDVMHHISDVIYGHSRSPQHAPSTMLERMVLSGRHGRKTGRGFYTYAKVGSGQVVEDELTPTADEGHEVSSVAVLGSGALAQELVGRFEAGGLAVTHVADASEDLFGLAAVGLVVEAQDEDVEEEAAEELRDVDDLFAELGEVTAPGTILATVNTYSAVALAAISGRPEDTVVLRVHAPTPNGQVVEVGRTIKTSEETVATLRSVVTAIGAAPVVCKDRTGLVVDALLVTHLNDCVRMLDEGYASAEDIDTALLFGLGYPMGPFAMIDHLGADEVLAVAEELYSGTSGFQSHLAPSPLLVEHVLLEEPFLSGE
ncbi:3-hydroxyacyl-CoA dehydrogenase NAD-binding domain-containing protein [Ornithinimicrobium sp. F0845]|uniref:3-hydroxyacyl-CoA dehydrogenase family protein n=1 Tax=Ornithinimicrobium sp. F0845 TaxID=2926412 RepID=UPI001FF14F45|nr:3-hydroxyacyl-CoA dehydrogenase NAD-binding domain-containing protein [Ornithinimicrobium sp. F0845]MCK0112346.1 3-hydroxyacyl-CoA dehydrogenase NAD-binding domain-containing protein [Ornithinimicrobium sp. F0845]